MVPVMEALDQNNPTIPIYEVDTMESPEIASHFLVKGVPYIAFCENREILYAFTGLTPLNNLQYVLDNIDDTYFRINGTFRQPEFKKSYWFEISIVIVLAFLIGMIFFLPAVTEFSIL